MAAEKVDESGVRPAADPVLDHDAAATDDKTYRNVVDHARAATTKEQNMTLMEGVRLYPKAIMFSFIISSCIIMEGYDISLINNFCMSDKGPTTLSPAMSQTAPN